MLEGELDTTSGSYYITASGDDIEEDDYVESSLNQESNLVPPQIPRRNTDRDIFNKIPNSPSNIASSKIDSYKKFDDFNLFEMRSFIFIGPQFMSALRNIEYSDFFQAARTNY